MTLLLTERDVRSVLTMEMALTAVEAGFRALRAGATNHSRRRLPLPHGLLHYMASTFPERNVAGLKLYPGTRFGVNFLIPLYAYDTGRLLALIEGDALGRMRTGAASGVATRYLACAEARTLGVIGAGGQALTQLEAVCAVRPITQVLVYSRNAEKRAAFVAAAQARVTAAVTAVAHPREAVEAAEVVVTMTNASTPVFEGAWLKPGTHVNAAGSNHLQRQEIDLETVRRSALIAVDMREQAQMECGDLAPAVAAGLITWDAVVELADVITGAVPGRPDAEAITLFESHGLSVWDTATAALVYEQAVQRGLGVQVPLFEGE